MRVVKLQILAEDIMEKRYGNSFECPITRALRRAGYDLRSVVNEIKIGNTESTQNWKVIRSSNHSDLDSKVFEMVIDYEEDKIIPKDFEFDLILDDYPPLESEKLTAIAELP